MEEKMVVRLHPDQAPEVKTFQVGTSTGELSEADIRRLGLYQGMLRFGRGMARQLRCAGIKIVGVEFVQVFDPTVKCLWCNGDVKPVRDRDRKCTVLPKHFYLKPHVEADTWCPGSHKTLKENRRF